MTRDEANVLSRRLQIHLERNHFGLCHAIIEEVEEEQKSRGRDDGKIYAIAEIPYVDLVTVSLLEKRRGLIYIKDLEGMTEEDLLKIDGFGSKRVAKFMKQLARARKRNEEIELVGRP